MILLVMRFSFKLCSLSRNHLGLGGIITKIPSADSHQKTCKDLASGFKFTTRGLSLLF